MGLPMIVSYDFKNYYAKPNGAWWMLFITRDRMENDIPSFSARKTNCRDPICRDGVPLRPEVFHLDVEKDVQDADHLYDKIKLLGVKGRTRVLLNLLNDFAGMAWTDDEKKMVSDAVRALGIDDGVSTSDSDIERDGYTRTHVHMHVYTGGDAVFGDLTQFANSGNGRLIRNSISNGTCHFIVHSKYEERFTEACVKIIDSFDLPKHIKATCVRMELSKKAIEQLKASGISIVSDYCLLKLNFFSVSSK